MFLTSLLCLLSSLIAYAFPYFWLLFPILPSLRLYKIELVNKLGMFIIKIHKISCADGLAFCFLNYGIKFWIDQFLDPNKFWTKFPFFFFQFKMALDSSFSFIG